MESITLIKKPEMVLQDMVRLGIKKSDAETGPLFLKAVLAGVFIALSAAASSAATFEIDNHGLAKLVAGAIFPVGLMMVIILGGELFTGNSLTFFSKMSGKSSWTDLLRILVVVFIGNMIGSVCIAFMVYGCGQFDMGDGALGGFVIKVAVAKVTQTPAKLFISANLCNVLVCLSVLMAKASRDVEGKIWSAFFPILAFVIGGYEHCVANMYYIPAGLIAATNDKYREAAIQLYGVSADKLDALTIKAFLINNLVPVTMGNLVGGVLLVAVPFFIIYRKKEEATV